MSLNRRRAALTAAAVLVALLGLAVAVGAQEAGSVRVAGSAIAAPLVEAVAAEAGVGVTVNTAGSGAGLADLCAGQAEIALASRPLTAAEEAACTATGIAFHELLLGHAAAAVIANAAGPAPQCLTTEQLNAVFAPSAAGVTTTWQQVDSSWAADPLTVIAPSGESLTVTLLDNAVEGDGLRADAMLVTDEAAVVDAVASTPGALGMVNATATLPEGVRVLELSTTAAGCTAPTADALEARIYAAAYPLFAYVNAASADAVTLGNALATSGARAAELGFVAPSEAAASLNTSILADGNTGREFSRHVTEFTIQPGITGSVLVAGSAAGYDLLSSLSSAITAENQGIILTNTLVGQTAGLNSLCAGTADIAAVVGQPTAEQLSACTSAGISPLTIPLGGRPAVLVANTANSSAQCLTSEQIATIITGDAANWNAIDASFPDLPLTLVVPTPGNSLNDLLSGLVAGPNGLLRTDGVSNGDPLYRAAAVANVEGGLTFMDWSQYLRVLENEQANIQLVSVDAGDGCITPSEQTFEDGTYPLFQPLSLVVNPQSLTNPAVQATVWYLLSDSNYALLAGSELFGLPFEALAPQRYALQDAFTAAAEAAAVAAESTPEATPEATPAS